MLHTQRMSPVDTAWLRMDRPTNLMQIVGVMLFEGALDVPRLRRVITERLLPHERFRQVVRHVGLSYVWADHPDFDLDQHLRHSTLTAPAGKAELERFVADLVSTPLIPSRPLWEWHLVDTSMGGQALVMRIHHCIGDGIALVKLIMSLADGAPEPGPARAKRRPPPSASSDDHDDDMLWSTLWRPLSDTMAASIRASGAVWAKSMELAQNPWQTYEYARLGMGFAAEAAKLLLMPNDSRTRLKGKPSATKRVAWSERLSLPDVKAVSKALGCSVNDLLLSSVSGALGAYLLHCGDDIEGVVVRAMVPVNLRQDKDSGKLGNQFGLVVLELPVGTINPLSRLYETQRRMLDLKGSLQAPLSLGVLSAVGLSPKAAQDQVLGILADKASAVMTNVPGPQHAISIAGAKLHQPFFWVPQSGDIGVGVSILSYNGYVQFGLITDKKFVPDPQRVVERFAHEFNKLMMLVLMHPPEWLADPEAIEATLRPPAHTPNQPSSSA